MANDCVEFGFLARTIGEQFPSLDAKKADKFEAASKAMSLLAINGYISASEKKKVVERIAKDLWKSLPDQK